MMSAATTLQFHRSTDVNVAVVIDAVDPPPKSATSTPNQVVDTAINTSGCVYWRCCTRCTLGCGATVMQTDDQYIRGRHVHVDTPVPGIHEATATPVLIKQDVAKSDILKSANNIVNDALHELLTNNKDVPTAAHANPSTLCPAANCARHADRPTDPMTLDFDIDTDFLAPNFFRSDVRVKNYHNLSVYH